MKLHRLRLNGPPIIIKPQQSIITTTPPTVDNLVLIQGETPSVSLDCEDARDSETIASSPPLSPTSSGHACFVGAVKLSTNHLQLASTNANKPNSYFVIKEKIQEYIAEVVGGEGKLEGEVILGVRPFIPNASSSNNSITTKKQASPFFRRIAAAAPHFFLLLLTATLVSYTLQTPDPFTYIKNLRTSSNNSVHETQQLYHSILMSIIILFIPVVLQPTSYADYRKKWITPSLPLRWLSNHFFTSARLSEEKAGALKSRAEVNTCFEIELLSFNFPETQNKDADDAKREEPTEEELKMEEYGKTLPPRYILACVGDKDEALRRWIQTCEWREKEGINTILSDPQPFFSTIKRNYPHYYCGRGKSGNAVYYEYCYDVNLQKLRANNCEVKDMIRHYIFMSEWAFTHLSPNDTDKTITVFDMRGVGVKDLAGEVMQFLKGTTKIMQDYYPERSEIILLINCSSFFTMIWSLVKPMINPRTQEKIRIIGADSKKVLKGLSEVIDHDQIPARYGGGMTCKDDKATAWKSHDYKCILENDDGEEITTKTDERSLSKNLEYDGDDGRWFSADEVKFREFVYSQEHNWSNKGGDVKPVEGGLESAAGSDGGTV
jgi:hypothetical protein